MIFSKIYTLFIFLVIITNVNAQSDRKEFKNLIKEYELRKKELVLSISNLKITTSNYNEHYLEISKTLEYLYRINKNVLQQDSIFKSLNPVSQKSIVNYNSLIKNWKAMNSNCIPEIKSYDNYLDYQLADTIWDLNQEFNTKKQRNQSLKAFNDKLLRRTEEFNYNKKKFSEAGLLNESCFDKLKSFDTIIENKDLIISDYNRILRWKYELTNIQYQKEIFIRNQQFQNIQEAQDLNKKLAKIHTEIEGFQETKSNLFEIGNIYRDYGINIENKKEDLNKLFKSITQFESDSLHYKLGFDYYTLSQLTDWNKNHNKTSINITNPNSLEDSLNQFIEKFKIFQSENNYFSYHFNEGKKYSYMLLNQYNSYYRPLLIQLNSKKAVISREYERLIEIKDNKLNHAEYSIGDVGFDGVGFEDAVVQDYTPPPTQEVIVYDVVDEPAEYPGGMSAAREYIKNNMKYPQTATDMGIEGKSYLKFIISTTGDISNVKVVRGVQDCPECDQEAIRLIKSMPKWEPGKINGKPVNSTFTLPVQFKLD
jgi:TonB family protein